MLVPLSSGGDVLTPVEQSELEKLETIIERNLKIFYEVGTALLTIRDRRLYRASHKTFEEYCRAKWSIGNRYADKLMRSAKVIENLKSTPTGVLPATERAARPLAFLPPDKQREVWNDAVKESPKGAPSSREVERAVRKAKGFPPASRSSTSPHTHKLPPQPTPPTRLASSAMEFAVIAISQLERIRSDDPKRSEALDRVAIWITKNK